MEMPQSGRKAIHKHVSAEKTDKMKYIAYVCILMA